MNRPARRARIGLLAAFALAAMPAAVRAQTFPERAVTIIVPFAAGGPTDVLARTLAEAMARDLGQPVLAENVTGAGGTIGAMRVVNARADGHTLLLGNIGVATAPALYRTPPYDPLRDLETIGLISPVPMVVLARANHEAPDFPALARWIRAEGSRVNIAHAGVGSASHLCAVLLRSLLQAPMTAIAFRGTAPVMTEMMAGRVDLTCDQTTNAMPFIRDGRVRAYAVTTPARLDAAPAIPTTAEAGLAALSVTVWHGFYAPRTTPPAVLERLAAATRAALADATVRQRLAELASTPEPPERVTPAAHRALLEAEVARWRPILAAAGEYAD